MTIDITTKAQKRAQRWAKRYHALAAKNPEAASWKICEQIAKETDFTTAAVHGRLKANGVIN